MRSLIGLNGLNFSTAAVQAGFGPFMAVWPTQQGWTPTALGAAATALLWVAMPETRPASDGPSQASDTRDARKATQPA